MERYVFPGLVANASTLGIHWIYDHQYLKRLASTQSLLFLRQEPSRYAQAKNAYFSYPDHQVGDVTVQGDILKWLYSALKANPSFTREDYSKLLYEQFRPGGNYRGYVETYAKKHVLSIMAAGFGIDLPKTPLMDDHLVGFMPYLACKELGLSTEQAWDLAQVYTLNEDYRSYYWMLDALFEVIPQLGLKKALEKVVALGPKWRQSALENALKIDDPDVFIDRFAGRACAIKDSMPVILHVLYHTDSYEAAVKYNALLGGAVSDRNTLIGAIAAQTSEVPAAWKDIVRARMSL